MSAPSLAGHSRVGRQAMTGAALELRLVPALSRSIDSVNELTVAPGLSAPTWKAIVAILLELPSLEVLATATSPFGTPLGSVGGAAGGATGGLACSTAVCQNQAVWSTPGLAVCVPAAWATATGPTSTTPGPASAVRTTS